MATAVFTGLAFLAAGIYACTANQQLGKMDATYNEIQQQTAAAEISAEAAYRSADNQEIQMRRNRITEGRQEWLQSKTLQQNQKQFNSTLTQMEGQTRAQQDAVSASNTASDRSIKESERILAAQNRPWIGITVLKVDSEVFSFPDVPKFPHVRYKIHYALHNYGAAPAVRVFINFFHVNEFSGSLVIGPSAKNCGIEEHLIRDEVRIPAQITIFPGGTQPSNPEGFIYAPQDVFNIQPMVKEFGACVAYMGPDRDQIRFTSIKVGVSLDKDNNASFTTQDEAAN